MKKPLILFGFLSGGPYYHLVGRTGNNVGRVVNGKNTFSMRPHPSSKPPTAAQLDVRLHFALINSFCSWIAPLIEVGFQDHKQDESANNAAVSYNLLNAVTGVSPNFVVDYPKFLYSRGKLSTPTTPEIATTTAAQVDFTWSAALMNDIGEDTDRATIMVYNPAQDVFITKVSAAARSAMNYTLILPAGFSGEMVHCYMSFVAVGGKTVSKSVYVGSALVI